MQTPRKCITLTVDQSSHILHDIICPFTVHLFDCITSSIVLQVEEL